MFRFVTSLLVIPSRDVRKQPDGTISFEQRSSHAMADNFRRVDAVRPLFRQPVRPPEPDLRKPDPFLANTLVAVSVRLRVVRFEPPDLLVE